MRRFRRLLVLASLLVGAGPSFLPAEPIRLHPENPHYFLYNGNPAILVTSAMHYGAVLNLEVDQDAYLSVLKQNGFNLHREFLEPHHDFRRTKDWAQIQTPLAPRPGKLLSPWARSDTPGYVNGGNKFDLDRWNDAYFDRLKEFCHKAEKAGIVVELVLFNVLYGEDNWDYSPLNAKNNVNGIGNGQYNDYNFRKEPALYEKQKALVRKVAEELNDIDNLYYEILNEPYWAKGIPEVNPQIKEQHFLPEVLEWQNGIAATLVEAESKLPKQHLIAENIANTYRKVHETCHPAVSILNFHYAEPAAAMVNYARNQPIAFDETADGCRAPDRRVEAWKFLMAGGAVYSNLDWSFAVDDMTGLGRNPTGRRQTGVEVREQLSFMKQFIEKLDFVHMTPMRSPAIDGLPDLADAYGLAKEGSVYALYFHKRGRVAVGKLRLRVPDGYYNLRFIDPARGALITELDVHEAPKALTFELPPFSDDLLVKIIRR